MATRSSTAGGFFLILAILGGFGWGVYRGAPLQGALVGTFIGVLVAVVAWLVDRRH